MMVAGVQPDLVSTANKVVSRAEEIENALRQREGHRQGNLVAMNWDGFYPAGWASRLAHLPFLKWLGAHSGYLGIGVWTVAAGEDGSLKAHRTSHFRGTRVEYLEKRSMGCGAYYHYQRNGGIPLTFSRVADGRIFFH